MTKKKKIIIVVVAVAALAAIIGFSLNARRKDAVAVETGKVERKKTLVAMVSATGEIKPKNFVELQAEISGVITELLVEEGDTVQTGDVLLRIDPVQTETEARAQEAVLAGAEADARNQQSQISVQTSNLERDKASLVVSQTELDRSRQALEISRATFLRKQQMFEDNLISRDVYDAAKNEVITAEAAVKTAQARVEQSQTQVKVAEVAIQQSKILLESAQKRVDQQRSFVARSHDLLSKTVLRSPLTGVITQLNVEVGERAVPGTLNNPAATLMIIADLSVIEAELKVDETDIVDLRLGQQAVVKVDALVDTPLKGVVTEIGSSALATTSTQEAKDFKVVVQLTDPPPSLRPGLSCTGEITTATKNDILAIPIQALTIREFPVDADGNLVRIKKDEEKGSGGAKADEKKPAEGEQEKKEFEGVFRLADGKAEFVPVKTGIVGEKEIEVLSGVDQDTTIVTGSYKTLRTLSDGDAVKIENTEGRG